MKLYDKTTVIINIFVIRNIFSGDAEADAFDKFKDLGLKTSFEERRPERVKRKGQKKSDEENQERTGLKILIPDQMLIKLPITLAQLSAGNNSEKLENEIRQLLYSLYRSKKTNQNKIDKPHVFRLILTGKRDFKNSDKNITLANLNTYNTWKNMKSAYGDNRFKISAPTWNDKFNLPDGSYSISGIQ